MINPMRSSFRTYIISIEFQGIGAASVIIKGSNMANKQRQNPILAGIGITFAPKKGAIATIGRTLATVKKSNEKKYSGFLKKSSVYA
jgi:hypothetical protein